MPHVFRPLLLVLACLIALPALAISPPDDDDDDDGSTFSQRNRRTTVVHATTPKDRYKAKLEMLNARVEYQREVCKRSSRSNMDFCMKTVDQAEYKGRNDLENEYKADLAKAAADHK